MDRIDVDAVLKVFADKDLQELKLASLNHDLHVPKHISQF